MVKCKINVDTDYTDFHNHYQSVSLNSEHYDQLPFNLKGILFFTSDLHFGHVFNFNTSIFKPKIFELPYYFLMSAPSQDTPYPVPF